MRYAIATYGNRRFEIQDLDAGRCVFVSLPDVPMGEIEKVTEVTNEY